MKILISIKSILLCVAATMLVAGFPLSVMAEEVAPSEDATEPSYVYNSQTGHWDSDKWYYDPASGTYKPVAPTVEVQSLDEAEPTIILPQSTNEADNSTDLDSSTDSTIDNKLESKAETGNADVIANTNAGDATSGNATVSATLLNAINSTLSTGGNQKAVSFVKDVMGTVNGDIMLQPMLLKALLEKDSTTSAKIQNSGVITNNINLSASTGNAGVIGNTSAGSATSGTASTVANVVNIINSMISANQSFIGTINIYGDLNGDILIAPDFIPQLLASNNDNSNQSSSVSIVSNDMQSIVNNVSLAAETGKAAVLDNTKAGSATSGDASTNVVIFNLTGHEIVAANSLLVFVNVLGKWVGVIVDAPAGANSAALASGVAENKVLPDLSIVSDNNAQIINNLALNSKSGDATVARNTLAGDATSGDAMAMANIANISGSRFGLSGWFGILFINVFGSWYGSLGIDTPYGNPILNNISESQPSGSTEKVIQFIPHNFTKIPTATIIDGENILPTIATSNSTDDNPVMAKKNQANPSSSSQKVTPNVMLLGGAAFLTTISSIGIKRIIFPAKKKS